MISRPARPSTSESTVSAAITPSSPSDMGKPPQKSIAVEEICNQAMCVNLDQHDQPMSSQEWVAAEVARAQLGVRPQTLYAYVSRGRVRVRPDPDDPRRSLYRVADLEALAERKSRSRRPSDV